MQIRDRIRLKHPMNLEKLVNLQQDKRLIWFAIIFISLISISQSLWSLLDFLTQSPPSARHQQTTHQNQAASGPDLLSYPLFGQYIPKDTDKSAIPKTLLNLKLIGVLKAHDKKFSQTTIQVVGGQEKNYAIGDTLPGGAKIINILDDSVFLMHNGRVEKLSFPQSSLPNSTPKPLDFDS